MNRRVRLLATTVVLALGAGAAVLWSVQRSAAAIAAVRPAVPDLSSWPEDLRRRVAAANRNTLAGLAELSRLYHANGFLAEAARCYAALERLQPAEARWPHRHAALLAGYGDVAPAEARWRQVTTLAPRYLPARLRLGELLAKAERAAEATQVFTDVLRLQPDEPYALLGLARLDLEAGRGEEARARLETVAARTDSALGADLLVSVYERLGQPDRASRLRAGAKAAGRHRDPPDPWLDELMEDCFDPYRLSLTAGDRARAADAATAVKLLEKAIALAPDDAALRLQLGTLQAEQGNLPAARIQLERCTVLAPGLADAWAHLSALLARGGDPAGAARILAEGLRRCPDSPGLRLMQARQRREAGRAEEAVAAYRESIRLRPNEAEAYLELATTLFRLERVDEGLTALHDALAAEPAHPLALALLALHAIGQRDEPAARRWLAAVSGQPRVPVEQAERLRAEYRAQFGRDYP